MSTDQEADKLIRLRKVTQEYDEKKRVIHRMWENMQNFSQGLRNELDDQYWSDHKIGFEDLEAIPEFNQYRFNYKDLETLFNISYIKETLDGYRKLHTEKQDLEKELGFSMDRKP